MVKKFSFISFLVVINLWLSDYLSLIKIELNPQLIEKISSKTTKDTKIRGPIIFNFLPWPNFKIASIKITLDNQNSFELENISLKIDLLDLVTLPNLEKILSQKNLQIEAQNLIFFGDLINIKNFKSLLKGLSIKLDKLQIPQLSEITFKDLNLVFNETVSSNGLIILQNRQMNYDFVSDKSLTILALENSSIRLKLEAEDLDLEKGNLSQAKLELLLDDDFFNKKNNNKPLVEGSLLNFSGTFIKKEGLLSLDNYKISGNLLESPLLKLDFYTVKDGLFELQSKFLVKSLNLNFLENNLPPQDLIKLLSNSLPYITRLKKINFNSLVKIEEISSKLGKIQNFSLDFYNIMGRVFIKNLSAKIENKGSLFLSGLIRYNGLRTKFEGDLKVKSDNAQDFNNWFYQDNIYEIPDLPLTFSSQISAIQNYFNFNHLDLQLGDAKIIGRATIGDIPYAAPSRNYFLKGSNINFNQFKLNQKLNNYLEELYLADQDKTGEEYFKFTSLHKNLRLLKKAFHLEGDFEQVSWEKVQLDKIKVKGSLMPNSFSLDEVILNNPGCKGIFSMKFLLPILRPDIKVKANFEEINTSLVKKFLPENFWQKKINGFASHNYDLLGDFFIKNLSLSEIKSIRDLTSLINLEQGTLKLQKLDFKFDEGRASLNGSINVGLINPTFTLDFNLYNMPGYLLPQALAIEGGLWSVTGSINGSNKGLQHLNGKADFQGAQALILGFDLNKALEILEGPYTVESKIKALDYYSKYGSTAFKKLSGKIDIKEGIFLVPDMTLLNDRIAGAYSILYSPTRDEMKSLGNFIFINKLNKSEIRVKAEVLSQNNIRSSKVDYSQLTNLLTE
jgi:hypothetical protein